MGSETGSALWAGLVAVVITILPASAGGVKLKPFQTKTESLIREAKEARERTEYELAAMLLKEAGATSEEPDARVALERGRLLRDRGQPDAAIDTLRAAAEAAPASEARLEVAALLVALGRWPEAVVDLRTAFTERGASLRADAVLADPRFGPIVEFQPYKKLLAEVREEQAGAIGKLQARLERIEASARALEDMILRLSALVRQATRLLLAPWSAVVALVLLCFVLAAGVREMGLAKPPWTLVIGFLGAAFLWNVSVEAISLGEHSGAQTIVAAAIILLVPSGLALAWRWHRGREAAREAPSQREPPATSAGDRE